jgi:hypothetical protein
MKLMWATMAIMVVLITAGFVSESMAQDLTYCKNGKGQVVIVTNYTCPVGYWPI